MPVVVETDVGELKSGRPLLWYGVTLTRLSNPRLSVITLYGIENPPAVAIWPIPTSSVSLEVRTSFRGDVAAWLCHASTAVYMHDLAAGRRSTRNPIRIGYRTPSLFLFKRDRDPAAQ